MSWSPGSCRRFAPVEPGTAGPKEGGGGEAFCTATMDGYACELDKKQKGEIEGDSMGGFLSTVYGIVVQPSRV